MRPIHKLNTQGYVVLHGVVGEDAVNALRIIARRSYLSWAPEDPTSPLMLRAFGNVPSVPAELLSFILERYYRTFFLNIDHSTLEWNYLKCYAGAPDQPFHRNFAFSHSNPNPVDVTGIPGSLLLATQDDTVVYGFGWNHQVALESNKIAIELRKGDLLFLRGDFIHARAGYMWNNLCVRTFLGAVFTRPQFTGQLIPHYDDLPPAVADACRSCVWGCQYVDRTTRALSKHLSGSHNFVTQSPRMRESTYDPLAVAAEAEILDETWPGENGMGLVITFIMSCANNSLGYISHGERSQPSTIGDLDMEMEALIAVDSEGSETDTDTENHFSSPELQNAMNPIVL